MGGKVLRYTYFFWNTCIFTECPCGVPKNWLEYEGCIPMLELTRHHVPVLELKPLLNWATRFRGSPFCGERNINYIQPSPTIDVAKISIEQE